MPTCAPGWQEYPLPLGGQTHCTSLSEAFPPAGGCATQVRDFFQHPRPGFRAQTAQAATICAVLRNLQKRKLQKRTQVSARRRTEVSVDKPQVQAMRMKGPASASISGRLVARQRPVQSGAQHLLRQPPPEMNICSRLSRYIYAWLRHRAGPYRGPRGRSKCIC